MAHQLFPWQLPPTTQRPDPDPTPTAAHTVPDIITRILAHYTHKSYGANLTSNLAPGKTPPATLPREVAQLYEWHDGYNDPGSDYVIILPEEVRLLSYKESKECFDSKMATAVDENWWYDDIWPVMAGTDLQTFVIVSKSTGKAAWRVEDTMLKQEGDVVWFDGLYELLREVEVGCVEERLCWRKWHGEPWSIEEGKGEGGEMEVDENDESDEEDEDEDEE